MPSVWPVANPNILLSLLSLCLSHFVSLIYTSLHKVLIATSERFLRWEQVRELQGIATLFAGETLCTPAGGLSRRFPLTQVPLTQTGDSLLQLSL
jgi:hypothetical protein